MDLTTHLKGRDVKLDLKNKKQKQQKDKKKKKKQDLTISSPQEIHFRFKDTIAWMGKNIHHVNNNKNVEVSTKTNFIKWILKQQQKRMLIDIKCKN